MIWIKKIFIIQIQRFCIVHWLHSMVRLLPELSKILMTHTFHIQCHTILRAD